MLITCGKWSLLEIIQGNMESQSVGLAIKWNFIRLKVEFEPVLKDCEGWEWMFQKSLRI